MSGCVSVSVWQIHGSGQWPYHLAARLARELWALIDDVFPGLQCKHPDVSVLCNNCATRLGSLSELAARFDEFDVSCDACRHIHLLEPYVGVAAGATRHADAAWEYWFRSVSSIKNKHHRKRSLVDVVEALFRCAPAWEGVPKLWIPVPPASSSTMSASPSWPALLPVCEHRDCLHAMVTASGPSSPSSMTSFWDHLRRRDSATQTSLATWLSRVSQTLQLCATTQPDPLQRVVPSEELRQARDGIVRRLRHARDLHTLHAFGSDPDAVDALAQLFVDLDHASLRSVRDGGLGNIFVCAEHAPLYTLREGSVDSLRSMVQQMAERLDKMQAKQDAAARRQIAIHEHGSHPRMFVLRLARATTPAHAVSGKVTCHLYLLCEHGGVPHPVKFRDTHQWRRIVLGIPNKTVQALRPGLKAMQLLCRVVSTAFGAASTLASFLGDELPDTEYVPLWCRYV